ncbi:hypothetical protein FA10DRAFT_157094 [Acaromyces ingoldii]|uniref:Non-classical export protein 1 n=1 Tax=Acaromyces ingoldii TaxID=215250 RepID=A0A316YFL4_9BASI|nr:hypothetical protein FA10DRAFT_157094 [Acaromyces ingoldii]PWN88207.1 hypothetical protein FA10DRAFT_157094 [Acaromyces ingoldii]
MVKYLVGRLADPVLGLATGVFAYYLWETDPRNAPVRPQGRTLLDLSRRWWNDERPSRILYSGPSPFGDKVERGDRRVV